MKIILKKNEEKRIRNGHLWVFSNEIAQIENNPETGEIVSVFDSKNTFLAKGFYNKNSLIAVRILPSYNDLSFKEYAQSALKNALNLREQIYPDRNSFRLCFSESDFLPGLIIDKYNSTFVLQIYSAGIEKNIDSIISILKDDFNAKNIFTKNEVYFRKMEGLSEDDKNYLGECSEETISDGKISYKINFNDSHKTGFYFDQSDNRFFIERFVKDKTVLDAFCNSGGFGLHAASEGAKSVAFVDSSPVQIETAKENCHLNNINNQIEFISSDVFDYLENCVKREQKFDIVIIDPPAFAKNKKSLPKAKKGYERLNKLAASIVNQGGFLVTSSCSFHLDEKEFLNILSKAVLRAGRKEQLIYLNGASADHPQLIAMPETGYLKFVVMRIL